MTLGQVAMLLGLFGAPALLLWAGHHWRKKSDAVRGAFWGGLLGHTVGALAASSVGLLNPVNWAADDRLRGFTGYWSMLVLAALGALLGAWIGRRSERRSGDSTPTVWIAESDT
jgi:hypothetical protein